MRISLTFGHCGHYASVDVMGKNVEATIDFTRKALEQSGTCDACQAAETAAKHQQRVAKVERLNAGLPPMTGEGWVRFRAMERRAAQRERFEATNAGYAKRLAQPGVTLRIKCEAKEALDRSQRVLAQNDVKWWMPNG